MGEVEGQGLDRPHVWLEDGEFVSVPRGVEHRLVAEDQVQVRHLEPAKTLDSGDAWDGRVARDPARR